MIASLIGFGGRFEQFPLTQALAWGSVVGSAVQFGIQLPRVARLMNQFGFRRDWGWKVFEP